MKISAFEPRLAASANTPGVGEQFKSTGLAIVVVGLICIFFVPVPPLILDVGLAASIALSILLLLAAIQSSNPAELNVFPTALLLSTVLRLALNISTTRLILTRGEQGEAAAGNIISGFSHIVMGGDFIVGVVVFAIIVTVNFVVITKGSTRIAEVGARFALDAIPGKQMAIDADLAAGTISESEAKQRRSALEEEAAFFGSMDGASKFVRGDAIAGIVILLINSLGGVLLGVLKHGMTLSDAVDVYMRLSVGDGLVTQIPALIVSLAAGVVVSKAGVKVATHDAMIAQLGQNSQTLILASIALSGIALLPGMPALPFGIMALVTSALATSQRTKPAMAPAKVENRNEEADRNGQGEGKPQFVSVELVLGRLLSARFLNVQANIFSRVSRIRKSLSAICGFALPEIELREDFECGPNEYRILVHGAVVAKHAIDLGDVYVLQGGREALDLEGRSTIEPAFGASVYVFPESLSGELRRRNLEIVHAETVLLTHLNEVLKENLGPLFSYRDLRILLDFQAPEYRRLLDEISPNFISMFGILNICRALLAERVSLRNLPAVLEAIADIAPHFKKLESMVEGVRLRLASQICGDNAPDGTLRIVRISPSWEERFSNSIRRDAKGEISDFSLDPAMMQEFSALAKAKVSEMVQSGMSFAVVTLPDFRPFVRLLIARNHPSVPVLSHLEAARCREIVHVATI